MSDSLDLSDFARPETECELCDHPTASPCWLSRDTDHPDRWLCPGCASENGFCESCGYAADLSYGLCFRCEHEQEMYRQAQDALYGDYEEDDWPEFDDGSDYD